MLLVLQLGRGGHDDLANVDPGYCGLGLSKGAPHTLQDNILLIGMLWTGWSCTCMWKPSLLPLFTMYMLAQIRKPPGLQRRDAYIHLMPCGHRERTQSTFAFFYPRLKILASGTPLPRETLAMASSCNMVNTGQGSGPWQYQDFQWHTTEKDSKLLE